MSEGIKRTLTFAIRLLLKERLNLSNLALKHGRVFAITDQPPVVQPCALVGRVRIQGIFDEIEL
jgi:hypothetical protein